MKINRLAILMGLAMLVSLGAKAEERGDADVNTVLQDRTFYDGAKPQSEKGSVAAGESKATFARLKPARNFAGLSADDITRKKAEIGDRIIKDDDKIKELR